MNQIVWIDLGVRELDRAVKFFQAVLQQKLKVEEFDGYRYAVFEHSGNSVSGCLVPQTDFVPLSASTLIYFNVDGRLQDAVEQVPLNGGKVIKTPHSIGPHGARAIVLDSEGNTIALHSTTPVL
ncbi:VOC family protein [Pleionea sediminis]|uniref:VOC family protein n=1 Tax=Pleionea sediminis TaxID=2569479 RepID=UPI00118487BF|nr:VOC family protein [Pleionea sediminis]